MSYKHHGNLTHYHPRTTPPFSEAELSQLTPQDVVQYMSFSAYESATPGPEDRPLNWRSDTAEFAKKAISHFMPAKIRARGLKLAMVIQRDQGKCNSLSQI